MGRDFEKVSEEDLQQGELKFGLPAAMIILLLVFGTVVGALVPLTMALISIIVALALVAVIGQFFEVNLFVTNMLVAMGLALGIDYSLFIVSRLREERGKGLAHGDAILNVSSTATRAVVLSGTAFSLALLGMFLVPTTILRSLALGAIVVAVVSIAVALTFHPALLMVLGDRIDRLRMPWLGKRVARLRRHRGPVLGRRRSRGGAPSSHQSRRLRRCSPARNRSVARTEARSVRPVQPSRRRRRQARPDRLGARLRYRGDRAGRGRHRHPRRTCT